MKTIISVILLTIAITGYSQLVQKISLPEPQKDAGMPLMKALDLRESVRSFDTTKVLSNQQISNLLWAAYGINRTSGKRTAPSSYNQQEYSIYVVLKRGVFLWDDKINVLNQVIAGDYREKTGTQDYVATAAMNLVYVADYSKLVKEKTPNDKENTAYVHCGFIAQNVYLCATSEGLSTCVRASLDRINLSELLKLNSNQHIILAHSIGYKK